MKAELVASTQFHNVLLLAPPPNQPDQFHTTVQLLRIHPQVPPPSSEAELPTIVQPGFPLSSRRRGGLIMALGAVETLRRVLRGGVGEVDGAEPVGGESQLPPLSKVG